MFTDVVTRAHLIVWRKELERRGCEGSTIRRKLSAVSSLFEYLCERNAVVHNPVKGREATQGDQRRRRPHAGTQ